MYRKIGIVVLAAVSFLAAFGQGIAALGNAGSDEPARAFRRLLSALGYAALGGIFLGPLLLGPMVTD